MRNEGVNSKPENETENSEETPMEDSPFDPCKQAVFETLSSIMDTLPADDIDVAYRVGRRGLNPGQFW